ncbi:hypothetical protein BT96DRAFT_843456, partial [Gymnopus androsaceus JB14]
KKFQVDKMAISQGAAGKRTTQEFNATKQKITPIEEKALADWILHSAERGLPPTHEQIKSYANAILQKRAALQYEEVGLN